MPLSDWAHTRKVLAVRLDNIGDLVILTPALRAIYEALPEAKITLLASPGGSQVAPLIPWVSDVITWRAIWQDISAELPQDSGRELKLVERLRTEQFDAAFIFTSFTQSPYPPAYVCYLAGIPVRIGHSNEFGGSLLTQWTKPPSIEGHQAERNLALLEKAGFLVSSREIELHIPPSVQFAADQMLVEAGIDPQQPFIALAPGASAAARRYDPFRFAEAAQELASASGLPILILASQREVEQIGPVLATVSQGVISSLAGKTSVPEFAAIIRRAALVIANNSSALHMAEAFGRSMVILYSGTEYETQWAPRRSPARLLRQPTACSPCFAFKCPYQMECLDIEPREVVEAALELLKQFPARKRSLPWAENQIASGEDALLRNQIASASKPRWLRNDSSFRRDGREALDNSQ